MLRGQTLVIDDDVATPPYGYGERARCVWRWALPLHVPGSEPALVWATRSDRPRHLLCGPVLFQHRTGGWNERNKEVDGGPREVS